MTNPVRIRSHFEVIDLVVVSSTDGMEFQLQERGMATVPIAPHRFEASPGLEKADQRSTADGGGPSER